MKKNWKYWVRLAATTLGSVLVALALVMVVFVSVKVNSVLHPPRKVSSDRLLKESNIQYQTIDLLTRDGIHLSAWYTPSKNGALILLAHSYGDHRPQWVYQMLARKGYGVLAWDSRAQGISGGDITTLGYSEVLDVKAALDYALAQPDIQHIGGWGGSMGGATMIRATVQYPQIEAIFVDSSFASLNDEFDFLVPYPLLNPLAKLVTEMETGINIADVDPVTDIGKISPRPVFLAQGTADNVAAPDSAEKLYEAAGKPRFLWTEKGIPHLGLYFDNPRRYQRRLIDFFDEWLLKK